MSDDEATGQPPVRLKLNRLLKRPGCANKPLVKRRVCAKVVNLC